MILQKCFCQNYLNLQAAEHKSVEGSFLPTDLLFHLTLYLCNYSQSYN